MSLGEEPKKTKNKCMRRRRLGKEDLETVGVC